MRFVSVSSGFRHSQRAVLNNSDVVAVVGAEGRVQLSSGTFDSTFVDGKLRVVGKSAAIADVNITATRDGNVKNPWRILATRVRTSTDSTKF